MSFEQLWAPWRLDYIKAPKAEPPAPSDGTACFLCRYRDEHRDADNLVVGRGPLSMVVLNRYPYNNGHLLIAPLEHKAAFAELTDDELLDVQRQIRRMIEALSQLLSPDGFNIGLNLGQAAGAGLPGHLHWHVVPRWGGDSNYMTVVAGTNVIPQSLAALYEFLRESLGDKRG